ncbi:MAG: hypothetical protein LBI45_08875 [Bacteroidales bacterium]|nr:hypothetical protein [Bacteroidales bacterium]
MGYPKHKAVGFAVAQKLRTGTAQTDGNGVCAGTTEVLTKNVTVDGVGSNFAANGNASYLANSRIASESKTIVGCC